MSNDYAAQIERSFTYSAPFGDQAARYLRLRSEARALAETIAELCPSSREMSLALTHLQETVMWANAAIACNEKEGSSNE